MAEGDGKRVPVAAPVTTRPRTGLAGLLFEVRRRRVVPAMVGYGTFALLALRAVDWLSQAGRLPAWALALALLVLGLGLPVSLLLAWTYDLTGRGIRRTPAAAPGSGQGTPHRARQAALLAGIALLAAVPGAVYYAFFREGAGTRPPAAGSAAATTPSIAVLPFADMSEGKDQESFADGVAEEILNALTQVEGLRVVGRTSSFSFKGRPDGLADIGRKLNAAMVLEGSVRKAGARLRITAQLVNASDGFRVWSRTFDRGLDDVFGVQEEIARAVVEAMRTGLLARREGPGQPHASSDRVPDGGSALLGGQEPSTRDVRTASPLAYERFLLGRGLFDRGTVAALRQSVDALEAALALEPGYAPALAWLSVSLALLEALESSRPDDARRDRALRLADRAVALAPGLAEAYWARAFSRFLYVRDWAGASADLEKALALRPGFARALTLEGLLLAALGRLPEAIRASRRAAEADPLAPQVWQSLASFYNAAGELDRALEAVDHALEVAPGNFLALRERGFTLLLQGRREEALALFEKHPSDYMRLTGTALTLHGLGRYEESRRALARLIADQAPSAAYQVAQVQAWTGDADQAFAWLERARLTRDPGARYAKYDPFMQPIRGDRRWPAVLRKLNLPAD